MQKLNPIPVIIFLIFHSKYFRHKKMLTTINTKFLSSIDYASANLDYNIKGMFSQQISNSINNNIIIKHQVIHVHILYFSILLSWCFWVVVWLYLPCKMLIIHCFQALPKQRRYPVFCSPFSCESSVLLMSIVGQYLKMSSTFGKQ